MTKHVKFWGVGGTGISLMKTIRKEKNLFQEDLFDITLVDRSKSNITEETADLELYLMKGRDGSGQEQSINAADINPHIDKLFEECKPAKFNILVFGAAGGSGSVIGSLMAKAFAERGVPFVCFVIGSTTSSKYSKNTLSTMKSLTRFANVTKTPIPVSYYENRGQDTNSDFKAGLQDSVNKMIYKDVHLLLTILQPDTINLDDSDKIGVFNYTKANRVLKPAVVDFFIYDNPAQHTKLTENNANYIATCSLIKQSDSSDKFLSPCALFSLEGYLGNSVPEDQESIYMVVEGQTTGERLKGIQLEIDKWTEIETLAQESLHVGEDDGEDGFCF